MWLLETKIGNEVKQAIKDRLEPSVLEREAFLTATSSIECSECRILSIAGSSAEISVKGILTKTRSFLAWYIGGGNTTYSEIVAALAEADKDPNVRDATVNIDSPGGNFDGLFEALAAIQAFSKPITAKVTNLAASAAYAIAAQCDRITVANRAARVGSIGVVATFYVYDDEIEITSTQAPKKRPDVTTDEGKAMVREELDAMHDLFVDSIAKGRGKTIETINAEFGQGATLLADDALNRGMIDSVIADQDTYAAKTKTATSGGNKKGNVMDLKQLKAEHPDVYAEAVQDGVAQEKDRVTAHLTMGEASGDMKIATEAIKSGDGMTATLQAKYMAAGMNKKDIQARQEDNPDGDLGDGDDDHEGGACAVSAMVESKLGIEGDK
jgi:ClpP class serine protease